jgi:hypothetical protein
VNRDHVPWSRRSKNVSTQQNVSRLHHPPGRGGFPDCHSPQNKGRVLFLHCPEQEEWRVGEWRDGRWIAALDDPAPGIEVVPTLWSD